MSFPKRIRHWLETHAILQAVLKIVVDEIRKTLIACSPTVSNPQIGAISFIQYFGNTLNYHPHFHLIGADGIFSMEKNLQFHEAALTQDDVTDTQERIQKRVLKYFCKRKFFNKDELEKMLSYENSGFSLDASVKIQAWDKAGLERLIKYCARPPFKSENIRFNGPWINYRLPKPCHTGKTFIQLEPVEFIERISHFIPYPRRHRRHYHGVLAPSSPQRMLVTDNAQKQLDNAPQTMQETREKISKVSKSWAQLISRVYEVDPLICSNCGKKIKIIAFVTQPEHIRRILNGISWPTDIPEFDPPYEIAIYDNVCHLLPNTSDGFQNYYEPIIDYDDHCQLDPYTEDGFLEPEIQVHYDAGPDPPPIENIDPSYCEEVYDCSHWEYAN